MKIIILLCFIALIFGCRRFKQYDREMLMLSYQEAYYKGYLNSQQNKSLDSSFTADSLIFENRMDKYSR